MLVNWTRFCGSRLTVGDTADYVDTLQNKRFRGVVAAISSTIWGHGVRFDNQAVNGVDGKRFIPLENVFPVESWATVHNV